MSNKPIEGNQVIKGDLYIGGSIQRVDDIIATKMSPELISIPEKTPVNAVGALGTMTVTGGASQIADGYTVTIDTKVYTFKTTLTPTEGEILIGISDTAALLNLLNAINQDGTPNTDYKVAAAHPTVEGTSSDATTIVVTALIAGVVGNAIATTKSGAEISWGAVTLESGVDGTVGVANEFCADGSYLYHCVAVNAIADDNWRRVTLGTAY